MRISVIVCTYERSELLEKCVQSLLNLDYKDYEVIVVYGGAQDCSEEIIQKYDVIGIRQKEKSGLAVARNMGIEGSSGEIIAFIDDDATADNDWLTYLSMNYEDESIGAVGGKVYKGDTDETWFSGAAIDMFVKHYKIKIEDYSRKGIFPILNGCNMSFRRRVLEEIGSIDPYYTNAYDDTDPCIQIKKHGYNIVYEPKAIVRHYASYTGVTRSYLDYYLRKNRIYLCLKNFENIDIFNFMRDDIYQMVKDFKNITHRYKNPEATKGSCSLMERGFLYSIFKIVVSARIRGYMDGFSARKLRRKV